MDVSYHTYKWVMSRIRMRHGTHTNESCRTYQWVMTHIWRIRAPPLVLHTYIYTSHITRMNVSYCTHESLISHVRMSHFIRANASFHAYKYVMSHIWMSHGAHMDESCHTYDWVMSHVWLSHLHRCSSIGMTKERANCCSSRCAIPVAALGVPYLLVDVSVNIICFIGLFCKRDLQFEGAYKS